MYRRACERGCILRSTFCTDRLKNESYHYLKWQETRLRAILCSIAAWCKTHTLWTIKDFWAAFLSVPIPLKRQCCFVHTCNVWMRLSPRGLFRRCDNHFEFYCFKKPIMYYYGMLKGQTHPNFLPEHPIIAIFKTASLWPKIKRVRTNWHLNYKNEILSTILHFPQVALTALPNSFSSWQSLHSQSRLPRRQLFTSIWFPQINAVWISASRQILEEY